MNARYLSLADAQAKAFKVDWSDPINKPVRPSVQGTKVFMSFPIEGVLDYIDWNPFFQVSTTCMHHVNPGVRPSKLEFFNLLAGECLFPQLTHLSM